MPIPINLLVTPIAEVLKFMYLPLAKQISYVKDINNNSETLRRKSDELEHKLNDLKREIQRAAENGKIPTDEAIGWLGNARIVIDAALGLIKEVHQGSCCSIWCLHCCGTYQLGKKILETTDLANELLGKQINPIFVDPLREKVLPFPTLQIKENTSAGATMEKILWYLRDGETGKIGIWGQRGIGKSTILKNIYNKFEGTSDYNAIIFVKFRKNEGLMRLVKDIAEDLALDLSKEEDQERGSRLIFKELKKRKFILILDGLCEILNLTEIGIPSPSEQKGCKILMASEKREICSSMAADVEIMIDPLPMEEAWELFCDKVGNIPPEIKPIAKLVCQECSGIAALIVSLGTALRNQELFVWKKALKVLQSPKSQLVGPEKLVAAVLKEPYVDYTPESASGETSLGQLRRAPVNKVIEVIYI
ncbi:hypothetical protein LUZ61_008962 [Rhynchospora tenuis]|uniref:NB-ARC domain-containing protein n=1 Tax=Rhynchospora tenuis TaxID=198213 RepID=A0AAD5ZWC6_9POAL|nr:hypothetical protein LUZ61_008962 [Rhynchospora tenuis]